MRKYNKNHKNRRYGRRNNNKRRGYRGGKSINIEKIIKKIENEPKPEKHTVSNSFKELNINEKLKENILSKGFTKPTPIQDKVIPHILKNKDLIGLANTGTGKTAAYLIPLLEKAINNPKETVLIVAPTRELASQINAEFYALRKGMNIYSALLIGGNSIGRQIRDLKRSHNFVVATPGRLIDLTKRKHLDISKVSTLVVDEVDRMFDMGFVNDIKYILNLMPNKRQSLFFSATINKSIESLVLSNTKNPIKIDMTTGTTAEGVKQDIVKFNDNKNKIEILHDLLIKEEFKKVLIFGKTKAGVNSLGGELRNRGFKVDEIHGNKRQSQRRRSLNSFRKNEIDILVATDVASRGIDVNDITHVINYELPDTFDDYVHRIGRTGRANKEGTALSFVYKR